MPGQISGFPDLLPRAHTSFSNELASALLNNNVKTVARIVEDKPNLTCLSWDLWKECFLSDEIPFQAMTVLARHSPPDIKWISDLYSNPKSLPKIKQLVSWWINSGLAPRLVNATLKMSIQSLAQDLNTNVFALPALGEIFDVFQKEGFDWEAACGKGALGPALVVCLSNPELSDLTENLSTQSIEEGFFQLLNSRSYHPQVWGSDNPHGPEHKIKAWNAWLTRSPHRQNAWEQLVEKDAHYNHLIQQWSDTWLRSGNISNSPLMDWLDGSDRSANPFNDPVFLGSGRFPVDIDINKIDIRPSQYYASPADVVLDMNRKLTSWVCESAGGGNDDFINSLTSSPSSNISQVAPNVFSVVGSSQSAWFERVITDPACLIEALPYFSDLRTHCSFLSGLVISQVSFIAKSNPDIWRDWTDDQGANLLMAWNRSGIQNKINDDVGMSLFEQFPRWFTQPDRQGLTLLSSKSLSPELEAFVKKKMLTQVSRRARKGEAVSALTPKL